MTGQRRLKRRLMKYSKLFKHSISSGSIYFRRKKKFNQILFQRERITFLYRNESSKNDSFAFQPSNYHFPTKQGIFQAFHQSEQLS